MLAATDALNRQRLSPATEDVFGRPLDAQADLPSISWEDDYAHRANPALFTELLTQAVPALRSAEWRLLATADGYAQSVLPLIEATTNHQGTHQAALMMLAADYTGGVALATLFHGFPVVGVHSPEPDWSADRAVMWLAKAEIKYTAPSTADVIVTCRVSTELIDQARLRFIQGEPVLLPLVVALESDEATVATATMTYFARRSSFLRPREKTDRPNGLFQHQLKASAQLVAGLRALNGSIAASPINDPFSATVAGAHGRLLADLVTRVLPELSALVASRTRDADDTMLAALESGVRQVVFIGVGLDCRPLRLLADCRNVTVFELDLPAMLQERERSLASLPQATRVE